MSMHPSFLPHTPHTHNLRYERHGWQMARVRRDGCSSLSTPHTIVVVSTPHTISCRCLDSTYYLQILFWWSRLDTLLTTLVVFVVCRQRDQESLPSVESTHHITYLYKGGGKRDTYKGGGKRGKRAKATWWEQGSEVEVDVFRGERRQRRQYGGERHDDLASHTLP